ncbi:WRKY transcription factor, partial [Reticulomyxa filosa]
MEIYNMIEINKEMQVNYMRTIEIKNDIIQNEEKSNLYKNELNDAKDDIISNLEKTIGLLTQGNDELKQDNEKLIQDNEKLNHSYQTLLQELNKEEEKKPDKKETYQLTTTSLKSFSFDLFRSSLKLIKTFYGDTGR